MSNPVLDTLQLSVEDQILLQKYGVPFNIFCDGSPESDRERKYWGYVDELRAYISSGNKPPESLEKLVRDESAWYNTTLVGKNTELEVDISLTDDAYELAKQKVQSKYGVVFKRVHDDTSNPKVAMYWQLVESVISLCKDNKEVPSRTDSELREMVSWFNTRYKEE